MAATTGGKDIPESSVNEKLCNATNSEGEVGEPLINGAESCSSFTGPSKTSSILRPSLLSASSASGASSPVFGATSSHKFGSSSHHFGKTNQNNAFSLRPSVFGSVSNSDNNLAKKPIVLRASQLEPMSDSPISSTTSNANPCFVLSPPKLNNPFNKSADKSEDSSEGIISSTCPGDELDPCQKSEKETSLSKNVVEVPKVAFVPLGSSTGAGSSSSQTPAPSSSTSSVGSFVFGQNLHERVEVSTEAARVSSDGENSQPATSETKKDDEVARTNGATAEMLFSSVIQRDLPDKQTEMGNEERKRKSLSEAAREYEESRAVKRKYEEVKVKTGEEEEINILQINCKLFAFNKEKSTWMERGRGTLRLNDFSLDNKLQSRVVIRVSGSLRVVLNTKIWAEMAVDRPSDKSVRLTAMDNSGEIKVFLVMATVKEIDQLYKALEWRVSNQKKMASLSEKDSETHTS